MHVCLWFLGMFVLLYICIYIYIYIASMCTVSMCMVSRMFVLLSAHAKAYEHCIVLMRVPANRYILAHDHALHAAGTYSFPNASARESLPQINAHAHSDCNCNTIIYKLTYICTKCIHTCKRTSRRPQQQQLTSLWCSVCLNWLESWTKTGSEHAYGLTHSHTWCINSCAYMVHASEH